MAYAPFSPNTTLTDEFTGRFLRPRDLALPPDARIWSDLGNWFVISQREGAFLLDPDTGALQHAEWLDPVSENFGPRLPDGRFFVPLRKGGVGLVDPTRKTVTCVLGDETDDLFRPQLGPYAPFERGETVLLSCSRGRTYRFVPETETLELVPFLDDPVRVVGCVNDSVFVREDGCLARFDLETGERTQLFPRPR